MHQHQPPSGNKQAILDAALRLFTSRGFHATPTAQISKEAGISTGTLFHYFPDKQTLFDQLYLTIKTDLAVHIRSCDDHTLDPKTRLERCIRGYISWGVANPERSRFLDQFYHSPEVSDDVRREAMEEYAWMGEMVQDAIRQGVIRDLPIGFYFVMLSQILSGIRILLSSDSIGLTEEELCTYALDMIWHR